MTGPDNEAYRSLVADLGTVLNSRDGLARILDLEGESVKLIVDLSGVLDTDRGLASILGTSPVGRSLPACAPPSGEAEGTGPSSVRSVTGQDRIMVRSGRSRRYLGTMRRTVRDMVEDLGAASPNERSLDTGLADVADLLHREYVLVSRAADALADALPSVVAASRLTALVVEVDPDLRDDIVRTLRRLGLTVLSVTDHQSAITVCRDHATDIDVLVSNLILPKAGDLSQTAIQLRPTIGIVYLSGFPEGVTVASLVDDRVVLARPCTAEQLLAGVRTAVDRARTRGRTSPFPLGRVEQLLRLSSQRLGALHDRISGRVDAMDWEAHRRSVSLADQLLHLLDGAWTSASDFRGEDLTATPLESLEELDGVRWSDETAPHGRTRWPHGMERAVREHSRRVPGRDVGVWEITLGTVVAPEAQPAQALI